MSISILMNGFNRWRKAENEEGESNQYCKIPEEVGGFGIQTLGCTQKDGICLVGGQRSEMVVGSWVSCHWTVCTFPYQQMLSHLLGMKRKWLVWVGGMVADLQRAEDMWESCLGEWKRTRYRGPSWVWSKAGEPPQLWYTLLAKFPPLNETQELDWEVPYPIPQINLKHG